MDQRESIVALGEGSLGAHPENFFFLSIHIVSFFIFFFHRYCTQRGISFSATCRGQRLPEALVFEAVAEAAAVLDHQWPLPALLLLLLLRGCCCCYYCMGWGGRPAPPEKGAGLWGLPDLERNMFIGQTKIVYVLLCVKNIKKHNLMQSVPL